MPLRQCIFPFHHSSLGLGLRPRELPCEVVPFGLVQRSGERVGLVVGRLDRFAVAAVAVVVGVLAVAVAVLAGRLRLISHIGCPLRISRDRRGSTTGARLSAASL